MPRAIFLASDCTTSTKKNVTYMFSILTFLLVVGEDGLVRVTIS